ncbi:MAG: metal ABC transporter substrate-binding protein, partial [Bacillota bacterium]
MKNRFGLIIVGILAILIFSGCQGNSQEDQDLTVYTSIYPLYEAANEVAGDNLDVRLVVPNGAELHSYRPTPKKIAKLEQADLFFYNGLGLEPWAKKVADNQEKSKNKMINISQHVNLVKYDKAHTIGGETSNSEHEHEEHEHEEHEHEEHEHEGEHDPHLWLDPLNMKLIAEKMKEKFIAIDSANKEEYENNYQQFAKKIDELNQKYESALADKKQEYILVSHSAFGYLGDRYDFKQLSVTGVAPHEEPSPGILAELTNQAEKHD